MILEGPPKKKQKANQSNLKGITSEGIKWYSNRHPAGKWRDVKRFKVSFIFVTKTWIYDESVFCQKFFAQCGMCKTMINA